MPQVYLWEKLLAVIWCCTVQCPVMNVGIHEALIVDSHKPRLALF
jgi:hypothetical protein